MHFVKLSASKCFVFNCKGLNKHSNYRQWQDNTDLERSGLHCHWSNVVYAKTNPTSIVVWLNKFRNESLFHGER